MKRIASLLLSLVLLFSLTGCGDTDKLAGAILDAAIDAVEDYSSSSAPTKPMAPDVSGAVSTPTESAPAPGPADAPIAVAPPTQEAPADTTTDTPIPPVEFTPPVEEGEYYYDLENVVLYLDYYGELPDNYITKNEARALGWSGGTPERYLEGSAIGGDTFGNREGILPKEKGRTYTECDLNTLGAGERGAERLVFSNDGLYFHTEDHYEHFTEVWVEDGEVVYGK